MINLMYFDQVIQYICLSNVVYINLKIKGDGFHSRWKPMSNRLCTLMHQFGWITGSLWRKKIYRFVPFEFYLTWSSQLCKYRYQGRVIILLYLEIPCIAMVYPGGGCEWFQEGVILTNFPCYKTFLVWEVDSMGLEDFNAIYEMHLI